MDCSNLLAFFVEPVGLTKKAGRPVLGRPAVEYIIVI
jgi:hypothetical protein